MAEQSDKDKEAFLSRWSRRKLGTLQTPAPDSPKPAAAPAAKAGAMTDAKANDGDAPAQLLQLPPLEEVSFDTDFRAFMGKEVDEGVRRAALKKLFADPRFNVMDGLDTYIDDYTQAETISAEMLATLEHAKHTLLGPQREKQDESQDSAAAPQARDETPAPSAPDDATKQKPEGEDGAAG
jgi:hypothetical protein